MATNQPTNTYKTALMYSEDGSAWQELIPIKSTPDLGSAPERLETTNLKSPVKTYINGLKGSDEGLEFTANYILEDFQKLKGLENQTLQFGVWFDDGTIEEEDYTPKGELGRFTWTGQLSAYPTGFETNAVREITITITQGSDIIFTVGS